MIKDDIPDLARLYKLFWNEESSIPKMQSLFDNLNDNTNYIILSAVENNKIIGSIMGIICYELYGECKPFMVIEDFVVDPKHRRKGVGKSLFLEIEKYSTKNECYQILLVTENNRQDAINFYTKIGFDPNNYKGFKKTLK
jgi:ribosomal protein S18 acetylase RimI-like enzyme